MSELRAQIEFLGRVYKPVHKARLLESIATHQKLVLTDPAILVAALTEWCADGCTLPRQYWDRVDAVSDRIRGRYQRKKELQRDDPDL